MALLKRDANAETVTVSENTTYENNDTKERVVVFHVDMGRVVRFAPEGRGTEDRLPVGEFLERFTRVDEKAPKPEANNADGTEKA